jgi:hypothetical protein
MTAFRFPLVGIVLFLMTIPFGKPAQAAFDRKAVTYSIEPIIGYELQRKDAPTRTRLELTYGARLVAGYQILSVEAEYTQGKSDEEFPDLSERIEEKTEKIRIGLRSTYALASMLDATLRGGAEDQKIHTRKTLSNVVTESDSPSKVYPYVGVGLSVSLGSNLSLNGNVVATLKDLGDMKKNEYTTTFGVRIALNATR